MFFSMAALSSTRMMPVVLSSCLPVLLDRMAGGAVAGLLSRPSSPSLAFPSVPVVSVLLAGVLGVFASVPSLGLPFLFFFALDCCMNELLDRSSSTSPFALLSFL
ncbi:hypothetical protein DUNSADRAFT_17083 [Dunaliella salina]|uniref:Secreted peptide n=1 Tax=Dunaliella salina TaxID=3046 RepID=A0ABQ7G2E6_DUNSA|nr:hypothetical protein DUNSADRAFT_17083 [Dunaliella salina]|eukprot:KAF5828787.1 hypothetical protein DUNSADRAFT_17083 [Dunaliella salina]